MILSSKTIICKIAKLMSSGPPQYLSELFVSGTELLRDPSNSVLFASPPPSGPFSSPQYDIVQPDPTGMQESSYYMLVKLLFSVCNTCHEVNFQLFAAWIRLGRGGRYQHFEMLLQHYKLAH